VWRALVHQYNGSAPHPQFRVGGALQSAGADALGPWTLQSDANPVYTTEVPFSDGSAANFTRRERPKLLLGPDGAPAVLYTGVCQGSRCWTLAQPVAATVGNGTAAAAGRAPARG
jgi:hypothetical protein